MKKLLALLLACSAMSFAMVGCGDNNSDDEKESSSSSSSISESSDDESSDDESSDESSDDESSDDESSDDESSGDESSNDESSDDESSGDESSDNGSSVIASAVDPGQSDPAVIGDWYSEEMSGTFCFDAENQVAMGMDYSSLMYFNADKELVLVGGSDDDLTVPVDYDGSTLSVSYADETTGTTVELMTLVRIGDADPASLDGDYELISGDLYDAFASNLYGDIDSNVTMIVSGETLTLKMSVCEYSADGENIEMFGDGLSLFGIENQEDAVMSYTILGDKLTITDATGEVMEFTKLS